MMNHKKFKKSLEQTFQLAKEGISKEDKQFLLKELAEMAKMLEGWKTKNDTVIAKSNVKLNSK